MSEGPRGEGGAVVKLLLFIPVRCLIVCKAVWSHFMNHTTRAPWGQQGEHHLSVRCVWMLRKWLLLCEGKKLKINQKNLWGKTERGSQISQGSKNQLLDPGQGTQLFGATWQGRLVLGLSAQGSILGTVLDELGLGQVHMSTGQSPGGVLGYHVCSYSYQLHFLHRQICMSSRAKLRLGTYTPWHTRNTVFSSSSSFSESSGKLYHPPFHFWLLALHSIWASVEFNPSVNSLSSGE